MGKAILVAAALLLVGALGAGAFLLYRGGASHLSGAPSGVEQGSAAVDAKETEPQRDGGSYKRYSPPPSGRPAPPGGGGPTGAPTEPSGPRAPAPRPP